jgi:hypothetical protein
MSMEKVSPRQEEELLSYLDGKLGPAAVAALRKQLDEFPALTERLEELRTAHTVLAKNKLEEPSTNFTHRVMANLHRYPELIRTSPKNGLLLMFGTMVCTVILALLISSGVFDGVSVPVSLDKIPSTNLVIDGPITFSGKWVMNGIIALNLIIGFILLDRTVLRPLFGRRSGMEF